MKYSKIVKETHKPHVSERKRKEMEVLIKQTDKGQKPIEIIYGDEGKKKLIARSVANKSRISSKTRKSLYASTHHASEDGSLDERNVEYSTKPIKINWKKMKNPMVPKKKKKPKPYVDDYLLKKRAKREEREMEDKDLGLKTKMKSHNWQEVDQQDITDVEK